MAKFFKGQIHNWTMLPCDPNPLPTEKESNLGYMIHGVYKKDGQVLFQSWRTSPVVKHEGNRVETLNSIYELVGSEQ